MQDQPDGSRLIYHNGWWHSYNSVFNRKISDKTTIIVLSNHYSKKGLQNSRNLGYIIWNWYCKWCRRKKVAKVLIRPNEGETFKRNVSG